MVSIQERVMMAHVRYMVRDGVVDLLSTSSYVLELVDLARSSFSKVDISENFGGTRPNSYK